MCRVYRSYWIRLLKSTTLVRKSFGRYISFLEAVEVRILHVHYVYELLDEQHEFRLFVAHLRLEAALLEYFREVGLLGLEKFDQ